MAVNRVATGFLALWALFTWTAILQLLLHARINGGTVLIDASSLGELNAEISLLIATLPILLYGVVGALKNAD